MFGFQGGDEPPTNPQLCGNKRLALGISDLALKALKDISETDHLSVHVASLNKSQLDVQIVLDTKKDPLEQSFLFHILSR